MSPPVTPVVHEGIRGPFVHLEFDIAGEADVAHLETPPARIPLTFAIDAWTSFLADIRQGRLAKP